jgi:hypothetical protein
MKIKIKSVNDLIDLKVSLKEMVRDGEIQIFTIDHYYELKDGSKWQHFFTYPEIPDLQFKKYRIEVIPNPNLKNKIIYDKFISIHKDMCSYGLGDVSRDKLAEDDYLVFKEEDTDIWMIELDELPNEFFEPENSLYFEILEKINSHLELNYREKIIYAKERKIEEQTTLNQEMHNKATDYLQKPIKKNE